MNNRNLAINTSKVLTIGGIALGGYIMLTHLTLVLGISVVAFILLYGRNTLNTLSSIGFFIDRYFEKLMLKTNPIIVMEKHIKTLSIKKNKIENKMTCIKGKIELLNEKTKKLKENEDNRLKSIIDTMEKSIEYLNLHHQKLDTLTEKIRIKISDIESNMETRKLTHSAMKEVISVTKMSKGLLDDKDIAGKENIGNEIDDSLVQMRGEMEELLRQVNKELTLKI